MNKNRLLLIVSFLILGLLVAACAGGAAEPTEAPAEPVEEPTEAPAEEPTEEPMEEPTEAPAEEPTEEPMEEPTEEPMEEPTEAPPEEMAFEPMVVAAENCDYGGKISSVEAVDELTVQFNLCKPDPAFLAKIAFTPFGIQSTEWIEETGGTGDILRRPVGTGPYMVEDWIQGDQVIYTRFDDYWGEPAPSETAVLRWNQEGAARLVELQSGNVDYITNVSPDDIETVANDPNLILLPVANPNILYLGMTNTFEPFDNPDVRRAIAMGIDRQRLVDNFYPEGSEVASHFTPCSIPNGCDGEEWYEFDPEAARQMLADAGYPDGFETSLFYRDVFRVYLPEPSIVAVDFQEQLRENLGIEAEVVVMESAEFIAESTDGNLDGLYLLGWGADYPHVTNFLDFHFGANNTQFGDPHPEIYEVLEQASQIADPAEAAALYEEANNQIKALVPMVPIAHGGANNAALATVENAYAPPFGAEQFYKMDPGKETFEYMQNNEPISMYCPDETDGESLRPCQQVTESLLEYADDSGETVPELATSCEGNEDATVWTCNLREGVLFHDGTTFDANDVVFNWSVGIDAASPLHVGNTGGYDYFSYLWDGLINAPPAE
jgi:ABC-type transport system substrate-binding protein